MTEAQAQQLKQIVEQLEAMQLEDVVYFELPARSEGLIHIDYKGNAESLVLLASELLTAAQQHPGTGGTVYTHGGNSGHEIEISYAITDAMHNPEVDDNDLTWGCQLGLAVGVLIFISLLAMTGIGIYTSYQWLVNN